MSASAPNDLLTIAQLCPRCHASSRPGTTRCWLCLAVVEPVAIDDAAAPPAASQTVHAERVGSYSLASLMMFMTLLCVIFGVSSLWPGVGIPLGVVVLIVWIRTSAVARRRLERGLSVSRAERTQLFLASFGATLALLAVTGVAGCAAFVAAYIACAGAYIGSTGLWEAYVGSTSLREGILREEVGDAMGHIAFAIVALAIAIPALWWIARIIRRRWQDDIGGASTGPPLTTLRSPYLDRI